MEKYQMIKKLGSGSFGNVEKAQNIETKEIVAIKKLKKKYGTWEECLQLSEVKALRKIVHPNIIKLKYSTCSCDCATRHNMLHVQ